VGDEIDEFVQRCDVGDLGASYKNLYTVGVTNAGQTPHLARQLTA
jgi:hypothetical protein